MSRRIGRKMLLAVKRNALFAARPFMGNRRYTKRYINLLRKNGLDIQPYETCGFIATSVNFDMYDYSRIHIGKNVYLTHDVVLLVHDQSPVTAWNATHASDRHNMGTMYSPSDIVIGDNVFIGMRSIILPGTRIGNDVIIAAGSVVRGDIQSGTVCAGVPAREIQSIDAYADKLAKRNGFLEDVQ